MKQSITALPAKPVISHFWRIALACVLGLVAIISVGHIWVKNYSDNRFDGNIWGVDLYQFWYGGQFLWQGKEPYTAMLQHEEPYKPGSYMLFTPPSLNSNSGEKLTRKWPIDYIPGSAPLFLVLAPLALLPWVSATIVWGVINICLGLAYIALLTKLIGERPFSLNGFLLVAILGCLLATRQLFELGQNSLLVVTLMFGALLISNKHPVASGILLGIAMSKFTLAFPIFLYFLYRKWFKALLICIATQLVGLLAIALFTHSDLLKVAQSNLTMAWRIMTTQQDAGYSAHLFALNWGVLAYIIVGLITIAMVVGILLWVRNRPTLIRSDTLSGLTLISILSFWSLLSIYHARHDWMIAMLFIALVVLGVDSGNQPEHAIFSITQNQRLLINLSMAVILAVWMLPLYIVIGSSAYNSLYGVCNIAAFALSLGLLFKIRDVTEQNKQKSTFLNTTRDAEVA